MYQDEETQDTPEPEALTEDDPSRDRAPLGEEATVDPSREPATVDPDLEPDGDGLSEADSGLQAPPTEDPDPDAQPNAFDSLEVVTTSPDDGRRGPGRTRRQRPYNSRPGGLEADDPFWTFGTPPESWGSSVKKPGGQGSDGHRRRPRMYFGCRSCGVKVEKKRAHGRGKVPCPMCGRWMNLSEQG